MGGMQAKLHPFLTSPLDHYMDVSGQILTLVSLLREVLILNRGLCEPHGELKFSDKGNLLEYKS